MKRGIEKENIRKERVIKNIKSEEDNREREWDRQVDRQYREERNTTEGIEGKKRK